MLLTPWHKILRGPTDLACGDDDGAGGPGVHSNCSLRCAYPCQAHVRYFIQTSQLLSKVVLSLFYAWETEAWSLVTRIQMQVFRPRAGWLLTHFQGGPCVWQREGPEVRQAVVALPPTSLPQFPYLQIGTKTCFTEWLCGINGRGINETWPEQRRAQRRHSSRVPLFASLPLSVSCTKEAPQPSARASPSVLRLLPPASTEVEQGSSVLTFRKLSPSSS